MKLVAAQSAAAATSLGAAMIASLRDSLGASDGPQANARLLADHNNATRHKTLVRQIMARFLCMGWEGAFKGECVDATSNYAITSDALHSWRRLGKCDNLNLAAVGGTVNPC